MTNSIGLTVAGSLLVPRPLDQPVPYLGISVSMDLDWSATISKIWKTLILFTTRMQDWSLTIQQATYVINTFLLPSLDLPLRYVDVATKTVQQWDQCLSRCIGKLARLPRPIRPHALSSLIGMTLVSQHEIIAKVSECFIRLNGDTLAAHTGRLRWRSIASSSSTRSDVDLHRTNRLVRVRSLARSIQWDLLPVHTQHTNRRNTHTTHALLPPSPLLLTTGMHGSRSTLLFDHIGEWGSMLRPGSITVFTDGSASRAISNKHASSALLPPPTSAWGLCYADDWLLRQWSSLPPERMLNLSHLRLATTAGGAIHPNTSTGIFMAELQAVYRALQSVPLAWSLQIVSDSQAAIRAVHAWQHAISCRKRLRMPGRPLLRLIAHLIDAHARAGTSITLIHTHSHTAIRSLHSVGNSCADRVAGFCRTMPTTAASPGPTLRVDQPLPLHKGEHWLYATQDGCTVSGDVRPMLRLRMQARALDQWKQSTTRPTFACAEVRDLCHHALQSTERRRTRCMLQLLSDSLQFHSAAADREQDGTTFGEYSCGRCSTGAIADVRHVLECSGGRVHRQIACGHALSMLEAVPGAREALATRLSGTHDLTVLLSALFSIPPSPSSSSSSTPPPLSPLLIRILCGGFSDQEAKQAWDRHGVARGQEGDDFMRDLRGVLFSLVFDAWWDMRTMV